MALYRFEAAPVQRSKGHSAIAGAAYRSGTLLQDRANGKAHDYQRKSGIVESRIMAPEHAPGWVYDREELWNRAERAEKRWDAQPARNILLALPYELTDAERANLVYSFVQDMFVRQGMVADIAIHRPDRNGDERNEHAHILLTMRELSGDGFVATKQRDWNQKELLKYWREEWANYENRALEQAGFEARVDHRTLEAQGILREPTLHMGKDATAKERKGITTHIGDQNREIRARNEKLDALVDELAALDAEIAQEMENEPETVPTWDELKADAQSVFHSPMVEYYRQLIMEPDTEPEQEEKDWEEQKAAPMSIFDSPMVRAYKADIRERGEIREYGLGDTWFARTMTKFENLYYGTIKTIRSAIRDTWEKHVGRYIAPAQDRDIEPER